MTRTMPAPTTPAPGTPARTTPVRAAAARPARSRRATLLRALCVAAVAAGAAAPAARAQAPAADPWPTRPIRMLMPTPPGNVSDTLGRVFAKAVGDQLGQPVVVENRPGGASIIATEAGARSRPDGYTLLFVALPFITNQGLYDKLPYDTLRDFDPVVMLSEAAFVVVLNPKEPYRTLRELVEAARTSDRFSVGSPGIGSVGHIVGHQFNVVYGTRFVPTPYKGSAQSVGDTVAGHIPMAIEPIAPVAAQIKAGTLRAIASSHPISKSELPGLPTFAEEGFPEAEAAAVAGIVVPAGTPRPIVQKLNAAFNVAMQDPEVRRASASVGLVGGTPEAFGARLRRETDRWVPLIRKLGIKPE